MPRKKRDIQEAIDARIDASDLTPEEKQTAHDRARKHVLEARKSDQVEAYFKAAVKEVEREFKPAEQYEDFTVDLPEYTWLIKLDNIGYYHGVTYELTYSQARSMAEIQQATWQHDREIHGQSRRGDLLRQHHITNLSPNNPNGVVTTVGSMRI